MKVGGEGGVKTFCCHTEEMRYLWTLTLNRYYNEKVQYGIWYHHTF